MSRQTGAEETAPWCQLEDFGEILKGRGNVKSLYCIYSQWQGPAAKQLSDLGQVVGLTGPASAVSFISVGVGEMKGRAFLSSFNVLRLGRLQRDPPASCHSFPLLFPLLNLSVERSYPYFLRS